LSYPASTIDARTDAKVRGLLLVALISLAAAAIAALFVSGTVTGPLRRLQRATERLATGDFTTRADVDEGPPEVRSLAVAFNTMTERIDELVDQQRAFAADASHQLRTPLTALRLQLDRGAQLVGADPEQARMHLEAAGAETERLQHLIQALLLLARPNAGAELVPVDVATIVRDRVETWRPFATERDLELHLGAVPTAHAAAADGALEQIIDNYIDNAIGIAPPGSLIEVVVVPREDTVEVHVLDRGPGMPPDHLAHAFDRFWRAGDPAREGSGLGLAIVHRLAQSSGATVALSNRPEGGLDAMVALQRGSAAPASPFAATPGTARTDAG
jgi:signal transduction histidine kinase